jgi:hypothetical protein
MAVQTKGRTTLSNSYLSNTNLSPQHQIINGKGYILLFQDYEAKPIQIKQF